VHFLQDMMAGARIAISEDRFPEFRDDFKPRYSGSGNAD